MGPDEVDIGVRLVRQLIDRQFPRWAALPVAQVRSAGTDNAIFRLGSGMAVRLPRRREAAAEAARQHEWLPRLARLLPLAVPVPLARGAAGDGFPFPWLICRWLPGENVADQPDVDLYDAAGRLGRFVAALHRIDATGAPPSFRGGPPRVLDARVRRELRDLAADGTVDPELAATAWQTALAAPAWARAPVWLHADLYPVNLLARHGQLTAVIDFGGLGAGDPAIDMLPAWAWLTAQTRDLFRAQTQADDATWARGRGWALGLGIGAACYYRDTNPTLAAIGQHAIAEVLTDHQRTTT